MGRVKKYVVGHLFEAEINPNSFLRCIFIIDKHREKTWDTSNIV